mmetsp:Transcript_4953/g.11006  ORF Transcript_4953/g.11006 Transcript_4953/m.11006 type:complete len:91 (-) Transcript_4953:20-292(-)
MSFSGVEKPSVMACFENDRHVRKIAAFRLGPQVFKNQMTRRELAHAWIILCKGCESWNLAWKRPSFQNGIPKSWKLEKDFSQMQINNCQC